MLDEKALILIAHSDWRTLVALYTLLDAEGYFVAPCFSRGDLLKYCGQYKPEVVMTSDPLSDDEGGRLLDTLREQSPDSRIVLLPDRMTDESGGAVLDVEHCEELLRIAEALPAPRVPLHLNGF